MSFNIQNYSTAGYGDLLSSARSIWDQTSKIDQRSYESIYNVIKRFRQTGRDSAGDVFDTPTLKFFKIFFHFGDVNAYTSSDAEEANETPKFGLNSTIFSDAGLLIPTFILQDNEKFVFDKVITAKDTGSVISHDYQYYRFNSAWAYLKNNGEEERAMMLKYFITLLSDISSNYPWYFPTIEGLDSAVNRNIDNNKGFVVDAERPKITIKCLQDAVDDRIGTLLDLYRAISYSWATKREILPSNLRKFNMSIYVFEAPTANITKKLNIVHEYLPMASDFTNYGQKYGWFAKDPNIKPPVDKYVRDENGNIKYDDQNKPMLSAPENDMEDELFTSYKLFEFHNCEIDYNSTKSALSTLDNQVGVQPTYDLNIYFDDCYEHRYNSFHGGELGDMLLLDTATMFISSEMEYTDGTGLTDAQQKAQDVLDKFTYRLKVLSEKSKGLKDKWYGFGAMADGAIKQLAQNGLPAGLELKINADDSDMESFMKKLANGGVQGAENELKGAVLGNLHGFSLSDVGAKLDRAKSGDISAGVDLVSDWFSGDTKGSGKGREARDLIGKDGKAQYNLKSHGADYKNPDPNKRNLKDKDGKDNVNYAYNNIDEILQASESLGNLNTQDSENYKYNDKYESNGKLFERSDSSDSNYVGGSLIEDKSESEIIEENIRSTKIDKYNKDNKIGQINTSNRNGDNELGGYEINLIGDNPQSRREKQRKELATYNIKDAIGEESDYKELDKVMKGSKYSLIGGTRYDDLGSQMVEMTNGLNETIKESTDYRPANIPKLGGTLRGANDYSPYADNGKNIGSKTIREEKDYKAELSKRQMNNLAKSMISNI